MTKYITLQTNVLPANMFSIAVTYVFVDFDRILWKKTPLNFNHDASRLIIVMCQHTANDCYKLITKSYENYSLIKWLNELKYYLATKRVYLKKITADKITV